MRGVRVRVSGLAGLLPGGEPLKGARMVGLPSGTVTFLFTDLEGSTRLWEERPDEMRVALVEHDAMVRSAIDARGTGTAAMTWRTSPITRRSRRRSRAWRATSAPPERA